MTPVDFDNYNKMRFVTLLVESGMSEQTVGKIQKLMHGTPC